MKNIEAIVFDVGGVLVDLNLERCIATFRSLGFERADEMVSCYHPAKFFGELERGEITAQQFYDRVRETAGVYISNEDIKRAYEAILESIPIEKLRLIESLRERGYKIYALSNISEVLIPRIKELMEADNHSADYYFDQMFLSFEMGVMKPSPEIYDKMVAQIALSPDKILFIDDGESNVIAARERGMQVYLAEAREDFSHIFAQ